MLLSHVEEGAVLKITLRVKFLNVGAWFPYIYYHSVAIKITNFQNLIIT